ncbi:MAG TPA: hypothetical protein VHC18_17010, partial [Amycolatopsis sp.]|nr:hypothetical protein [Amycolatopsis sp.]
LFARWMRDDERQADTTDRELDESEQQGESTSGLWWENDPMLAERFRRERAPKGAFGANKDPKATFGPRGRS